ncbi:MAG: biotin/lipoyl-containing protein, partial [Microcystaceae cyanobacterium]
MIHDIFMPALSSTMTEGKIVSWIKSPGDKVEKGETVVVVESDKADMDVESFYEGYLAAILVEAGQEAPVGNAIALIAETEAEIENAKAQAPSGQSNPPKPSPTPSESAQPSAEERTTPPTSTPVSPRNGRTIVSPRAKKLAKELKVDLKTLQGSGPHGRIVAEDIEKAAGKVQQPVKSPTQLQVPPPPPAAQPADIT